MVKVRVKVGVKVRVMVRISDPLTGTGLTGQRGSPRETASSQSDADKGRSSPECAASGADWNHLANKPTCVNTAPAFVKARPRGFAPNLADSAAERGFSDSDQR